MKKLLEIYHYGDCGAFDEYNPFKLFDETYVSQILYHIGKSEPYSIGADELSGLVGLDKSAIKSKLEKMLALDLVSVKDDSFKVNFTIIYEKDLLAIDDFSKKMALEISKAIYEIKEELYKLADSFISSRSHDVDELLYHIICSDILDGLAIDTFSEKGLFKTSKMQKGYRDYILFGFEKNKKVDDFSENILCSCNNYRTGNLSFVSFGDAAGDRNDFYRFSRQVSSQINKVNAREETKASYIKLLEKSNHEIAVKCAQVVKNILDHDHESLKLDEEDEVYASHLKSFKYIEKDCDQYRVSVPVFYPEDNKSIMASHDLLVGIILPILEANFSHAIDRLDISATRHGVDIKEVLNEMWHQVFGNINEQLVKSAVVKTPDYFENEGRYLKAIYLN